MSPDNNKHAIAGVIRIVCDAWRIQQTAGMVTAWTEALSDVPVKELLQAVRELVRTETKAPAVAQLRQRAMEIRHANVLALPPERRPQLTEEQLMTWKCDIDVLKQRLAKPFEHKKEQP